MRGRGARETFSRLLEWDRGQADAERLTGQLLRAEGYKSIDPSHPLGGQDGLKDVVCEKDAKKWVAGAYFPRGKKTLSAIKKKFRADLAGVVANGADGFVFVTNQELKNAERESLVKLCGDTPVDILHLERITSLLNTPPLYGIRLDFLDIEMNREEQVAFMASSNAAISGLQASVERITEQFQALMSHPGFSEMVSESDIPLSAMREFKEILDSIAGYEPYGSRPGISSLLGAIPGHMSLLNVPLDQLKEFAAILDRITGHPAFSRRTSLAAIGYGETPGHVNLLRVPIEELREFAALLDRLAGNPHNLLTNPYSRNSAHVSGLRVPVEQLTEYENVLNSCLKKLREIDELQNRLVPPST